MVRYIPLELNSNCCFLHVTPHSDCFTNWQSAWKNSCCITELNRISCFKYISSTRVGWVSTIDNWTYQLVQVSNLFKQNHTSWCWYPILFWKIHTNLVLILDLLKNFHSCLVLEAYYGPRLIFGWYVAGVYLVLRLIWPCYQTGILPQVPTRQVLAYEEAGITSCPYKAGFGMRLVLPQITLIWWVLWDEDQY